MQALAGLLGVAKVEPDYTNDTFAVTLGRGDGPSDAELIAAVAGAGFEASVKATGNISNTVAPRSTPTAPPIEWPAPIREAMAEATREMKPLVVVDFHAAWCGPCRRLEAETLADSRVREFLAEYAVFRSFDTDAQPSISKAVGVTAIPDVRILDANGRQLGHIIGFCDAARFLAALAHARAEATKFANEK